MNSKIEITTEHKPDQEALNYFAAHPNQAVFIRDWRPDDEISRAKAKLRHRQPGWWTMIFRRGEVVKVRIRPEPGVVLTPDNMNEAILEARLKLQKIIQAVLSTRPKSAETLH